MNCMDKECLDEVRDAAKQGAKAGSGETMTVLMVSIFAGVIGIVIMTAIISVIIVAVNTKKLFLSERFEKGQSMVLENHGIFGHTTADFAEALLGDRSRLCRLEVFEQEIADAIRLTDTGLGDWEIFTKTQLITYHGTAIYTVDLSGLTKDNFSLNDETKEMTVYIPHAELEPVNIQSKDIEFGDVNRGMLAFGEIKATPEDMAKVQTEAQKMMEAKLLAENVAEKADRFAVLAVWELFQPILNSVENGYSLVVEFE